MPFPPISSAQASLRTYLLAMGLTSLVLLIVAVGSNYLVDPYYLHQWDSRLLQREAPARQKLTPWVKTYAAYRYHPEVVYLGSSRTEIGLPVKAELFPGKRVLNLALSGGSPENAISMLQHTSFFQQPELVVWGLEFGWIFVDSNGNSDLEQAIIAKNALYPAWRWLLNVKRTISMDMMVETMKVLTGTAEQTCEPLMATFGQQSERCVHRVIEQEGGTATAFEKAMITKADPDLPDYRKTLGHVREMAKDLCQQGVAFRFYIQPNHVLSELQYIDYWEQREQWTRDLVRMTDGLSSQGCDVRLMDFSGFNSVTTEEIPQATGTTTMAFYWEQSHCRSQVGEWIITKLLAPDAPAGPADFGVLLNNGNIEAHLGQMRHTRDSYLQTHPREARNFLVTPSR